LASVFLIHEPSSFYYAPLEKESAFISVLVPTEEVTYYSDRLASTKIVGGTATGMAQKGASYPPQIGV